MGGAVRKVKAVQVLASQKKSSVIKVWPPPLMRRHYCFVSLRKTRTSTTSPHYVQLFRWLISR